MALEHSEKCTRLTHLREWFLHARNTRFLICMMKRVIRNWASVIDIPVGAAALVNNLSCQIAKSCSRAIRLTFILDILRQQTAGTVAVADRARALTDGHTMVKRTQLLLLFFSQHGRFACFVKPCGSVLRKMWCSPSQKPHSW